ncbi:Bud site selection protein bud4 [Fusarium torreyae]|uniref:Bud site selection protein bud4 n=1 Tax=Fusarium torreyae TaxID=1237075 RepID=A0A9W8VK36_9HYPO|nr:Bud site selection protein bud4 [Fusarium torreyae]
MASGIPRPLSELSPTEMRRNSPSWHRQSTGSPKKSSGNPDSSPFQSSPLESVTSPRLFWQNRNTENLYGRGGSPSPNRRSSIERLQKASRVRNSNILALEQKQEYDPTRIPQIERPLAKVQGNAFGSTGSFRSSTIERPIFAHHRSESSVPTMSPTRSFAPQSAGSPNRPLTPSRDQVSPTKSSLSSSRFKNSFDMETGTWSFGSPEEDDDLPIGRSLHRHAKSVTFDAAPPQINEYEMATPDLSSIGTNSREGSYESIEYDDEDDDDVLYDPARVDLEGDSFDASLEDTDKTPVVGPDDWRGDSPMVNRNAPRQYDGSPMPENAPSVASAGRPTHVRTDSSNSNGEHRPLPPLPGFISHSRNNSAPSSPSLSATAERMLGSHRNLPSPPQASTTSKSDIHSIGNAKMSLEERLRLMMLSDDNDGKSAAEQQRERRLRRAIGRERLSSPTSEPESTTSFNDALEEQDDVVGDISALEDYQLPPRISRDSIMRKVNGNNKTVDQDKDYIFSSPPASRSPSRSPERQVPMDPDVPIPSTEDSIHDMSEDDEEEEGSVIITRMPESEIEFYEDSDLDFDEDESKLELPADTDSESHYSEPEPIQPTQPVEQETKPIETPEEPREEVPEPEEVREEVTTPRATPMQNQSMQSSLPDFASDDKNGSFSRDFESYMLPEPEEPQVVEEPVKEDKESEPEAPKMADAHAFLQRPFTPEPLSKPEYDGTGWGDPEDEYDDDCPSTPDSVIHHPVPVQVEEPEQPAIPERSATIKAPGSKLKTRLSNTPSDISAMREARRQVSMEVPDVPPIPDKHSKRLSKDNNGLLATGDEFINRHPSFKNRSLTLDLDLGLSLDQDFERVIEAQKVAFDDPVLTQLPTQNIPSGQVSTTKTQQQNAEDLNANITSRRQRGYLMRQNTKVVTASDKDTPEDRVARSVGNSPVKEDRPMSCIVEPWNSKPRQRSVRKRVGGSTGPVPPMPGQESNATAVSHAVDEDLTLEMATPESGERGRLFVKVMGVKDLDLPLPRSESQLSTIGEKYLTAADERTWFSLTLDNGVHCVTTAWLELARNAPIGQEFELVVPNDLEFQLTLNVKLEKPVERAKPPPPAVKVHKHKTSTFSRVFASPKKRKELELRQREEEERAVQLQKDAQTKQRNTPPSAYELLSPLAAEDGSFGRAYVCLREHENRCFGRPYMAEVACFNEWATEEAGFASSVKSKRGNTAVVRRAPYKVGKLELQLLFVPRPKNATDDDMPKSMNSCIRELKAAEERMSRNWEGHLSQQGGDCPYWRRRYFKLVGTKLTAYHEATRQPRATINLANAKRLIDDRRALTEKETTGKGGRRRRSAFAEDEEGYMFVEEGFRIRFNNGELIDFYADTAADKEGWMKVLTDVVGRDNPDEDSSNQRAKAKWCQLVLRREEQLRRRASGRRVNSRPKSMFL